MIAVIISQFPEMHETFVMRELKALHQAGLVSRIYSLKQCRDAIKQEGADELISITDYCAYDDWKIWLAGMGQLILHPIKAAKAFRWVLSYAAGGWTSFAKAFVIWIQSMAIAGKIKNSEIKHLHAHWATLPTTSAAMLSEWLNLPFSFTAHAWDIFVQNVTLQKKLKLAKRIITCTGFNRSYLMNLCPEAKDKIVLNYHGVDIGKFTPTRIESKPPLFLSVGRLVETKGFKYLIEAYHWLKLKNRVFRAVIVGNGPLQTELLNKIRHYNLTDCVEMKPSMKQEELRELFNQAYAFVQPSVITANGDRDGIPNVILEALAMGVPVVSTVVSGIPEAVIPEINGFLVEPRNPKAITDALEQLLNQPEKIKTMADEARKTAEEKFDDKQMMNSLVLEMQSILENKELAGASEVL